MRYFVTLGAREIPVDLAARADGGWRVTVDGIELSAEAITLRSGAEDPGAGATLSLRIGARVVDLMLEGPPASYAFAAIGLRGRASVESESSRASPTLGRQRKGEGSGLLVSPMPGRVARLLVSPGDDVAEGAPLIVIEAMKMENELGAPRAGKVTEIFVRAGETVEAGGKLLLLG